MKRLLVFMMAFAMTLSLAACGGDENPTATTPATTPSSSVPNTSESIDFVEFTGNGLSFALPIDFEYVQTDENTGGMIFTNEDRTAVVTVGVRTEDEGSIADLTDDALLAALSAGGLSDATLDSSGTVEQDGGTTVVGFGKGTLQNGTAMNAVIQYFFPADGVYHAISYLYTVDAGSSLDDNIELVLSTVKTAKE